MIAEWIEMDACTSYTVESDTGVRVCLDDDGTDSGREDERLIASSLGHRLGGTWSRKGEWSDAGNGQVVATWHKK